MSALSQRKPDNERINRVAPKYQWVNLPESGNRDRTPDLPALEKGQQWTIKTQLRWAQLWASPQSLMWDNDTMPSLERYLSLYQMSTTGYLSGPVLTGMQGIEDRLGLNPKAMQTMLWRIVPDHLADERFRPTDASHLAAVKQMPTTKRDLPKDW